MKRRIIGQLGILFVLVLGCLYISGNQKFFQERRDSWLEQTYKDGEEVRLYGEIDQKVERDGKLQLYLKNLRVAEEFGQRKGRIFQEKIIIYLSEYSSRYQIGNIILVQGTISFYQNAPNPGNFNQKQYYQKENIHAALGKATVQKVVNAKTDYREWLHSVRARVEKIFVQHLGTEKAGVLSGIVLGDKGNIGDDAKELYQKSGIGHLIAISGLHIAFVGFGLMKMLRKLRFYPQAAAGICMIFLWMYILMTGASVSAVRAGVMFTMRMMAIVLGRKFDGITALAVAAICILIKNPMEIADMSFWMSFGTVAGIYGICPFLWPTEKKKEEHLPQRLGEALRMSAAVQIIILPMQVICFYEFSLISILWNVVAIPLASILITCTFFAVITAMISPVSHVLFAVVKGILVIYEWGSACVIRIPYSRVIVGKPAFWKVCCYFGVLVIITLIGWKLQGTKSGQKGEVRRRRKCCHICQSMLCACLFCLLVFQTDREQVEIVMLDVGQGDCIYIQNGNENCLIDGGSSTVKQVGKYRIEPFLKSRGIGKLDYVWITHGDEDHVNGIRELLERKEEGVIIAKLILPPKLFWEESLYELAEAAKNAGTRVLTMQPGQMLCKQDVVIRCLWPETEPGKAGEESSEKMDGNNRSMVLSFQYHDFTMLFTGDLEAEGEAQIMEQLSEVDVLKVGHHGSKNGTSAPFLEVAGPKIALISAGKKNRYGHPNLETLVRLKQAGVKIYRTDQDGAVTLRIREGHVEVHTMAMQNGSERLAKQ